jgi:undecaprenyl-diphosphatase
VAIFLGKKDFTMDNIVVAIILGIVEGITEFLPISSTGHLIVAASFLNFHDEKGKVFEIAIQSGAMLAVLWEYRAKFWHAFKGVGRDAASNRFFTNIVVAFVPLAALGLILSKPIKSVLFNPLGVAAASIIGALIIFFVERGERTPRIKNVDDMTPLDALKCGLAQAFALFPGMSRSGSSIVGGMLFGLSRKAATEFSFFLGVPTLMSAGLYEMYKNRALLSVDDIPMFAIGAGVSFVVALVAIRALIRYVATHSLKPFAWYRIAFGIFVLAAWQFGWIKW